MPRRREIRARRTGPIHILPDCPKKAVFSIIISLVLWVGMCVGIWFLIRYQVTHQDAYYYLHLVTPKLINRFCWIKTLWVGIAELPFLIWAMIEYLFFYHKARNQRDKYIWYITPVAVLVTGFIVLLLVESIVFETGWITLIQMVTLSIVVFLPRICLRPEW